MEPGTKSAPRDQGNKERSSSGGSVRTLSLYDHYQDEAKKHKWIESEKAGHDLGERAIEEWKNNYWLKWCRARWLEHLEGSIRWKELDPEQFGVLVREYSGNKLLRDRVLDRIREGWENLEILQWAISWGIDIAEVTSILSLLDMNSCRLKAK